MCLKYLYNKSYSKMLSLGCEYQKNTNFIKTQIKVKSIEPYF